MTIKNIEDERRTHRIATYLSASENNEFQQAFVQSTYSKASEFHRSLVLESVLVTKSKIEVPSINTEVAQSLSTSVQAMCRYIAQLELLSCCLEDSAQFELQNKIEDVLSVVRQVGDICYRLAHFYRTDSVSKKVLADIVELAFTSKELRELVNKVKDTEGQL